MRVRARRSTTRSTTRPTTGFTNKRVSLTTVFGLALAGSTFAASSLHAQVFTVGEATATAEIKTDFTPTRVELTEDGLTERGRRDLVRMFEAEQGFAHRALPMGGAGLTLIANGNISPNGAEYKRALYEKGQSCAAGDRVVVTGLEFKGDRIVVDFNGGPYLKHRFLRHIQINGSNIVPYTGEQATGARVTLVFEGGIPEISAPELKSLLQPVVDFGAKSGEKAYADTLPEPIKQAIAAHEVLVGMNKRMVLASLGAPESKMRERSGSNGNGPIYEEWIYGHMPQTIRFVRFEGDEVSLVKIAAVGKSIEAHDKTEVAGYADPGLTREIPLGDVKPDAEHAAAPPTLAKPGEQLAPEANGIRKVQYPPDQKDNSGRAIPPLPQVPEGGGVPAQPFPAADPSLTPPPESSSNTTTIL